MAIRLTTGDDVNVHQPQRIAEGQTLMQPNDVIVHLTDRNASKNIYHATNIPGAREGASVWLEGEEGNSADPAYNVIQIGGGTNVTIPSTYENPNHIHFFRGRGKVKRVNNSLGGHSFQLMNFDNLIFDLETNSTPGMRDDWGRGRSGTFGAVIEQEYKLKGSMGLKIDNSRGTMTRLEIRGVELLRGGFAQLRTLFVDNDMLKVVYERMWLNMTGGGEGVYSGSTANPPVPRMRGLKIKNCIISLTAAELLQAQQIANDSEISHNVFWMGAIDFLSAFQPFQDTGNQTELIEGGLLYKNNLLCGYGSSGIQVFARDLSADQGIVWGPEVPRYENFAVWGGKKGHAMRIHDSFRFAPGLIVRDADFLPPVRDHYDPINSVSNYNMEIADVSNDPVTGQPRYVSPIHVVNCKIPDDGQPLMNEDRTNVSAWHYNISREDVPEPEFVLTGFEGLDIHRISKWSEAYDQGKYTGDSLQAVDPSTIANGDSITLFSSSLAFVPGDKIRAVWRGGPTTYRFYCTCQSYVGNVLTVNNITHRGGGTGAVGSNQQRWDYSKLRTIEAGEIVMTAEHEESVPMEFYMTLTTHEPIVGSPLTRRPDQNPAGLFQKIYWDENGRNSLHGEFNGNNFTTKWETVAADFRLVKDTYHALLRRGIEHTEQSEAQTKYGWEWKQTVSGTVRQIPGAFDVTLNIDDYSYLTPGRYYRAWVEPKVAAGFLPRAYGEWVQI